MAQNTFADFNSASSSNSTIEGDVTDGSVNIAEGCDLKNMNNAVRSLMAACNLAFGALPSDTARPSYLAAGKLWRDTTTATAPIVKYYDGTDDITVMTFDHTANTVTFSGAIGNVVEDTTPQLGGALDGQGNDLNNLGVVFLTEQAAAEADVAGKGQWWVKTATPNVAMFTDDAGTDFQLATLSGTETLSAKTLTSPTISGTVAGGAVYTSPVLTTPQINDTSADHQYIFGVSELAADRTVTLPLLTGNDTFVFNDFAATLTNKTIAYASNTLTGVAPTASPTFTGTVAAAAATFSGTAEFNGEAQLDGVVQLGTETLTDGTSVSLSMTGASKKTLTCNGAGGATITVSGEVADQTVEVWITQGATPRTVAWSGVDKWVGGSAPTVGTTTGDVDIIVLSSLSDGSTIVGMHVGTAS